MFYLTIWADDARPYFWQNVCNFIDPNTNSSVAHTIFSSWSFLHMHVCVWVGIHCTYTYIPICILIALLKVPEKWIFNFPVICECVSVCISQCINMAVDGILFCTFIWNGNWLERFAVLKQSILRNKLQLYTI